MLDETKKITTIIYWALMMSRFIFAFLLYQIIAPLAQEPDGQMIVNVVLGLAAAVGVLSYTIFRKSYVPKFLNSFSSFFYKKPTTSQASWSEAEVKKWQMSRSFQTLSTLCWALSESVAIFGLTIPLLGGSVEMGACLIAASILLGFFQKPHFEKIEANLKEIGRL